MSEPRFHQTRGPSPEVSHGQKAVLYVPETIPERQNPCESRNAPSSSPNSIAISVGVQAETIQGNVGLSSKMPLRGDETYPWVVTHPAHKRIRTSSLIEPPNAFLEIFVPQICSSTVNSYCQESLDPEKHKFGGRIDQHSKGSERNSIVNSRAF